MFRVITFIACVALSSCVRLHPLVVEQAHHDDYQAEKARDILKQVLGHTSEAYELKEGELGFSWKSCGKFFMSVCEQWSRPVWDFFRVCCVLLLKQLHFERKHSTSLVISDEIRKPATVKEGRI